jgi:hypothetical protein
VHLIAGLRIVGDGMPPVTGDDASVVGQGALDQRDRPLQVRGRQVVADLREHDRVELTGRPVIGRAPALQRDVVQRPRSRAGRLQCGGRRLERGHMAGTLSELDRDQAGGAADFEHRSQGTTGKARHQQRALALFVPAGLEAPGVVVARVERVEVAGRQRVRVSAAFREEQLSIAQEVRLHLGRHDGFVARSVRERMQLRHVCPQGVRLDRALSRGQRERCAPVPRHVGGLAPVPQPDRIPEMTHPETGRDAARGFGADAMIAVPVTGPRRHDQRPRRRRVESEEHPVERIIERGRVLPQTAIGQPEEVHVRGRRERAEGPGDFGPADRAQIRARVRHRPRMRCLAVRGDHDRHPAAQRMDAPDQTAGAHRLVIGVGSHDDEVVDVVVQRRRLTDAPVRLPDALGCPPLKMRERDHHARAPATSSRPSRAESRSA